MITHLKCSFNIELRTTNLLFDIELFISIRINIELLASDITIDHQSPLQSSAVVLE